LSCGEIGWDKMRFLYTTGLKWGGRNRDRGKVKFFVLTWRSWLWRFVWVRAWRESVGGQSNMRDSNGICIRESSGMELLF